MFSFAGCCMLTEKPAAGGKPSISSEKRTEWFRNDKFGMFIHWGIYSVPAGEWKDTKNPEYEKFAGQFNPVKFNARQWVKLAKDAGMKYIVITSKHHDGFCMYDSALTSYNIVDATPYKRDPMKELAAACKEAGLKFCFYYSAVDWHYPEFPAKYSQRGFHGAPNPNADLEKYVTYMKGQVKELLTGYGPIGIMWFDGGGSFRDAPMQELLHSQEIIDLIHQIQPMCLVNNRLRLPADYGTPEQRIPGQASKELFEVCMTLNNHWGYNKYDNNWKSPQTIIRNLADIAGKGGNYLLNVGPTAEGTIPEGSVKTLQEVGKWMNKYGESIYGTTAGPFDKLPWGRCTAKPGKLYLHVFDWPANGKLTVPGLKNRIAKAYLPGDGKNSLQISQGNSGETVISVPQAAPDAIDSIVVLEIEGKPEVKVEVGPLPVPQTTSGTILLKAADATVHGDTAHYESGDGKDNIGFWTNQDDFVEWTFKTDSSGSFSVTITFACEDGTADSEYTVALAGRELTGKVRQTGDWTTFVTDELGMIEIPKAGQYTLTVKPRTKPGYAVMNLKAVTLVPVRK
jgi:alpha-L-fucosidase